MFNDSNKTIGWKFVGLKPIFLKDLILYSFFPMPHSEMKHASALMFSQYPQVDAWIICIACSYLQNPKHTSILNLATTEFQNWITYRLILISSFQMILILIVLTSSLIMEYRNKNRQVMPPQYSSDSEEGMDKRRKYKCNKQSYSDKFCMLTKESFLSICCEEQW